MVIPVYNHPQELPRLIERLMQMDLPIVLVDDGSDQTCRDLMGELTQTNENIFCETHATNSGKGAAVKTGLRRAQQLGYTHALQVDADGQHNLDDIQHFSLAMQENPGALIAGYPQYDDSVPRHRYIARYLTHVWIWINTLSTAIVDSMCGFRIYPVAASNALIDNANMGNRMDFDPEFIVRWYWSGAPVVQLQTTVTYPEQGLSHFRLFHDNRLISWMHTRLFFGMLLRLPRLLARNFQAKAGRDW